MKKVVSFLLAFALTATMLVTTAFAADLEVYVTDVGANAGEEVIVDVIISGNPGFGAATLKLDYDSSVLTLKEMTLGLLAGGIANPDKGKVSFASATGVTGDGVLFSAIFTVAEDARDCVTPVSVIVEVLSNTADEDLIPSVSDGSVSVTASHVHSYSEAGTTAANCTEQGYTTYKCECGHSYRDNYVDALGHKYSATGTTAADCTTAGSTRYVCSVCGASDYDNYVDAKGHTYTKPVFNWADDYSRCSASYKCSTCSGEFTEKCHVTTETTPATEKAKGKTVYTATFMLDGQTYTDTQSVVLPKLNPANPNGEPSDDRGDNAVVLYVILAIIVVAALGALVFFFWKKNEKKAGGKRIEGHKNPENQE